MLAKAQRPPRPTYAHLPRPLRVFASHQLEFTLGPIVALLLANSFVPPSFALRPLHPLHSPPLDPTWHVTTWPGKFLYLSYRDPATGLCLKGGDDFYLVVFYVLLFLALREGLMRYAFDPLAHRVGIRSVKSRERFGEQGWLVAYYATSWTVGLYILRTSPYRSLFSENLWRGYPHFALPPLTKAYYLAQMAFWFQQLISVNVEKRRKDFVQYCVHHVITIALVAGSYACNLTRIGTAVLVVMDFSDIVLSFAKMLKYANVKSSVCDACFGVFMLSWVVTRHVLFCGLIYVSYFDSKRLIPYRWDPSGGFFWTQTTHLTFVGLLCALQVLMCFWFYLIARIAYRTLSGHGAEDTRSDASSDEEEPAELSSGDGANGSTTALAPDALKARRRRE